MLVGPLEMVNRLVEVGVRQGGRADEGLVCPETADAAGVERVRRRAGGIAMVDHDVAQLVERRGRIRRRDRQGDLVVGGSTVVGPEHVDLVGGDVVIGEQRRLRSVRGDPLAVVDRHTGLHRSL